MKNKIFLFTFLILLFFSTISLASPTSISTIGRAEIETTSNILTISFNIRGENQNQSQLNRDFDNKITEIITDLAQKDIISRADIELEKGNIRSNKQNNRTIYSRTDQLTITSAKTDFSTDNNSIKDFFHTIKSLDPGRQRARYNVNTNISFRNYKIQLTISNKEELNRQLIAQAITDSRQQAKAIASYLSFNNLKLDQIKEKESSNLLSFEQKLNPDDLEQIQLNKNFKLVLDIKYFLD